MIDISKYDYVIFDSDGVILDSNNMKSQAFIDSLPEEPNAQVRVFIEYHKQHGGLSRYEKFRYYFENMKASTNPEVEIIMALDRFSSIVRKGLLECNYVPGVLEFIAKAKALELKLFVVSGSDETELKEVFKQREILQYINEVFGSPLNKNMNTQKVIDITGLERKGLFFGDSESDYVAAHKYGIEFIYVKGLSEWVNGCKVAAGRNFTVIDNFLDIL